MAQYQRIQVVEARQYDGPNLTVVSDALGEQRAHKGDWLLGSEKGKITVKSAADFVSEGWAPYSATPQDDEIKAQAEALSVLKASVSDLTSKLSAASGSNDTLTAQVASLTSKAVDADALTKHVADLTSQLETAQASAAAKDDELTQLKAHLQAFTDAQAKTEAEQAAIEKALS